MFVKSLIALILFTTTTICGIVGAVPVKEDTFTVSLDVDMAGVDMHDFIRPFHRSDTTTVEIAISKYVGKGRSMRLEDGQMAGDYVEIGRRQDITCDKLKVYGTSGGELLLWVKPVESKKRNIVFDSLFPEMIYNDESYPKWSPGKDYDGRCLDPTALYLLNASALNSGALKLNFAAGQKTFKTFCETMKFVKNQVIDPLRLYNVVYQYTQGDVDLYSYPDAFLANEQYLGAVKEVKGLHLQFMELLRVGNKKAGKQIEDFTRTLKTDLTKTNELLKMKQANQVTHIDADIKQNLQ